MKSCWARKGLDTFAPHVSALNESGRLSILKTMTRSGIVTPQISPSDIRSKLVYGLGNIYWPKDATWQAVKQNGSLGLMAHDELHYYVYIYEDIAIIMEQLSELGARMEVASAIARRSPDGNLTPRDIEELITATSEVQAKVAYSTLLLRLAENALQKKVEEIPKIEQKKNQH